MQAKADDFDEAVKLGDKIAILQAGSKIVQYDSPERILAEPADDFVRSFVGAGAALKQLTLTRVRDVDLHEAAVARSAATPARRSERPGRLIANTSSSSTTRTGLNGGVARPNWTIRGPSKASRATRNWNRQPRLDAERRPRPDADVISWRRRRNRPAQHLTRGDPAETIMDAMESMRRSGEKTGTAT